MIKSILRAFLINGVALYLTSQLISGFYLSSSWPGIAVITVAFTLAHLLIGPILKLLLGSLNFITFGLVGLAIDVLLLYVLGTYLAQISFSSWTFPGFASSRLIIPAYEFNWIGSTIASAVVINTVRSVLKYLSS